MARMPRSPRSKELTEDIVAFRITKARTAALRDRVATLRVVGVGSHHQLCRKLAIDFLDGKLVYLSDSSRFENPTS
jgi:hypothetical protein